MGRLRELLDELATRKSGDLRHAEALREADDDRARNDWRNEGGRGESVRRDAVASGTAPGRTADR